MVAEPMHVARRLVTINVSPSDDLQSKLNSAGAGDTLVLADGTYVLERSGNYVLEISKDITIRAQNSGQAILDGENARRVIYITSGTVTLEGLNITRGYSSVRSLLHSELAWTLINSARHHQDATEHANAYAGEQATEDSLTEDLTLRDRSRDRRRFRRILL